MAKKEIKVYLEPSSLKNLKEKAAESGFSGRGAISHYLEKVSNERIAFIDSNVLSIFELLNLGLK